MVGRRWFVGRLVACTGLSARGGRDSEVSESGVKKRRLGIYLVIVGPPRGRCPARSKLARGIDEVHGYSPGLWVDLDQFVKSLSPLGGCFPDEGMIDEGDHEAKMIMTKMQRGLGVQDWPASEASLGFGRHWSLAG
ncbi:hypothetical protein N658DRAFT_330695 [Parathielavia hyrcaniae]|uniref:Uncharacterized protein n=1 Tax=Parathielavia hyrcaniae TaxID=113614 RepID=A0AAN6Q3R0_9PEZI|nr:hypothetical protein N658DRAFT_330695 [Parathielavia hyrcaniae]